MKNKEIEELLNNLKSVYELNKPLTDEYKEDCMRFVINTKEAELLLSYIEELQINVKNCKQENEHLRTKVDTYENPDDLTLFYMWIDTKAKDKMKYMENQIMILKQQIQMANDIAHEKLEDYKRMKDNFGSKVDVIAELKEDIEEYNDKLNEVVRERNIYMSRNKKAIERIEKFNKDEGLTMYVDTAKHLNTVLDILKGDSDE